MICQKKGADINKSLSLSLYLSFQNGEKNIFIPDKNYKKV